MFPGLATAVAEAKEWQGVSALSEDTIGQKRHYSQSVLSIATADLVLGLPDQ